MFRHKMPRNSRESPGLADAALGARMTLENSPSKVAAAAIDLFHLGRIQCCCCNPYASLRRPEIARRHAVGRLERPIERRDAVKPAGKSDIRNRLLPGLDQQPAAFGEALCGHGLGKADVGGFEQDVQVTNGNPEQIRHQRRGKCCPRDVASNQSPGQRQAADAKGVQRHPAARPNEIALDQGQLSQRLHQRSCTLGLTRVICFFQVAEA